MKQKLKTWHYRGQTIIPSAYVESQQWYLGTTHTTGVAMDEQSSPQFANKQSAIEYIDQLLHDYPNIKAGESGE